MSEEEKEEDEDFLALAILRSILNALDKMSTTLTYY